MRDAFYLFKLADEMICAPRLRSFTMFCPAGPCAKTAAEGRSKCDLALHHAMDPWHGDDERGPAQRAGQVAQHGIGAFVAAGTKLPEKQIAAPISIVPSRREQVPSPHPNANLAFT